MENYEKKYKEAMERMKLCVRSGLKITPEYIFPELAESQDEKIRKELIRGFNTIKIWNGIMGSDIVTWLEKQGEQKNEWSEEDKNFMYDTLSNLTELKDRYGEGYGNVGRCMDWLKSLKDRVGCEANCTTTKEWSRDDEQYLLVCKNALAKYQTTNKWDAGIISSWLEDKLKSIKPQNHWKPSDEQMEILLQAVAYFGVSWANKDYLALQSLYFDLKKLEGK